MSMSVKDEEEFRAAYEASGDEVPRLLNPYMHGMSRTQLFGTLCTVGAYAIFMMGTMFGPEKTREIFEAYLSSCPNQDPNAGNVYDVDTGERGTCH